MKIEASKKFKSIVDNLRKHSLAAGYLSAVLNGEVNDEHLKGDINYLDISNDGTQVTFLTYTKIIKHKKNSFSGVTDEFYSLNERSAVKPAKIFSKIFGYDFLTTNLRDEEIEKFHNVWQAAQKSDDLTLVSGKEILPYYHYGSYPAENGSTLWKSCMRQNEKQKCLTLYAENPEVCSMLVKLEQNKVVGRALFWQFKDAHTGKDMKIVDRIYTYHDWLEETFKKWATQNGAMFKARQRHDDATLITPTGTLYEEEIHIPIAKVDVGYYPYMDTFRYLDMDKKTLCQFKRGNSVRVMQQQDGGSIQEVLDVFSSQRYILKSDAMQIDIDENGEDLKERLWTVKQNIVRLKNGKHVLRKYTVQLVNGDYILKIFAVNSEIEGGFISKEDSVFSNHLRSFIHKGNAVTFNGDVTHKKYLIFSKRENAHLLKNENIVRVFDGDYLPVNKTLKVNSFYFPISEMIEIGDKKIHKDHLIYENGVPKINSKMNYFYNHQNDFTKDCLRFIGK